MDDLLSGVWHTMTLAALGLLQVATYYLKRYSTRWDCLRWRTERMIFPWSQSFDKHVHGNYEEGQRYILGYPALKAKKWCRLHFQAYWAKGEWRGNSSDLSRTKKKSVGDHPGNHYTKCRENLWRRPSFEHPNRWIGIMVPPATLLSGMLGRLLAASDI